MGTKNNPGNFDCYSKAEPDEPMFVLLGRDPTACMVVTFWVAMQLELGEDVSSEKIAEARQCARKLEEWATSKNKNTTQALKALEHLTVRRS